MVAVVYKYLHAKVAFGHDRVAHNARHRLLVGELNGRVPLESDLRLRLGDLLQRVDDRDARRRLRVSGHFIVPRDDCKR